MHNFNKYKYFLLHSVLALLIGVSLINNRWHVSPYGFSYYSYHCIASLLVMGSGTVLWQQKEKKITWSFTLAYFGCYTLYTVLQGYWITNNTFNHGHIYFVINTLLFVAYTIFDTELKAVYIARVICFYALLESLFCLLQYVHLASTYGTLFEVYGSLANPNYTAMFLAMAFPAVLYLVYTDSSKWVRWVAIATVAVLLLALGLLRCRTAGIGVVVGAAYFLGQHYAWQQKARDFVQTIKWWQLGVLALVLLVCGYLSLSFLYHFKQASSEGRLMIWKISLDLAMQQPLFGQGSYAFERTYNLAQGAYFASGQASAAAIFSADHVRVPYNDYLLCLIESGAVGLLLFVAFLGSLLALRPRIASLAFRMAYSGVLIFAVMSLFNSQLYVTPVFALLMLYGAIACSESIKNNAFTLGKYLKNILSLSLILVGALLFLFQCRMASGSRNIKKATVLTRKHQPKQAIALLQREQTILSFSDNLWLAFGAAQEELKDYNAALQSYQKAEHYTSDPKLFLAKGMCYANLNRYDEAIQQCSTALHIVPNRLQPRYALMTLYLAKQDTLTARRLATEIIEQTPKGVSKDAGFYKEEAKKIMMNEER
jgi:O-antigen polymerase